MTLQSVDAHTLLESPAHARLVDTDTRLGERAELAEANFRLREAQKSLDAVYASKSWRVGNALIRSAQSARVIPRKARSAVRLLMLKVRKES